MDLDGLALIHFELHAMPFFETSSKLKFRYSDKGSGFPIIFLHGSLGTRKLWRNQFNSALSGKYRLIAPDQRGHGDSERPESGYGLAEYVNDVKDLMDHLGLREAVLAGSSMGGVISEGFALKYPKKVRALVLVGSLARAIWLGEKERYIQKTSNESIPARVRKWFGPYSTRANIDYAIRQSKKTSIYFREGVVRDFGNFDLRKNLHKIKVPTLIIVGNDDKETPKIESKIINNAISGSELHLVPRSGHLVMLEQPRIFNSLLSHFLEMNVG